MGLGESLNSFITYIQYLFILIKTNVAIPFDWYKKIKPYILIVLNFDWSSWDPPGKLAFIKTLRFDYRVQYIIVCCFLPLFTTLILVTVFGDNGTVVLFTGTAIATFSGILGLFVMPQNLKIYFYVVAVAAFIVAMVGLLFSSAGTIIFGLYNRLFGKKKDKNKLAEELENRASGDFDKNSSSIFVKYGFFFSILRFTSSAIVYAVVGIAFTSLVRTNYFVKDRTFAFEERLFNQSRSYVGIIISVMCFIQVVLNLGSLIFVLVSKLLEFLHKFEKFQTFRQHVVFFIQKNTLKIIFLLMTMLYTPIVSTLLDSFFCKDYTCPKGTVFRDRFDSDYYQYGGAELYSPVYNVSYSPNVCVACDYTYNATCTKGLCDLDETRSMMRANPSIQCSTLTNFYAYGGIALLIIYGFGVPFTIFLLITIATDNLREVDVDCLVNSSPPTNCLSKTWEKIKYVLYFPIGKAIYFMNKGLLIVVKLIWTWLPMFTIIFKPLNNFLEDATNEEISEIWVYRAQFSNNLLRDTYAHFEYRMRYFLCWEIFLKLVITTCSVVIPYLDEDQGGKYNFAIFVMAAIQVIAALVLLITSPYIVFLEDLVASLLQIVTAINFIYGVLQYLLPNATWLSYFLFLNAAVPVLAVIHTILFFCIKQITVRSLKNKKIGDVKKQVAKEEEKELVEMAYDPVVTEQSPGSPTIPTLKEKKKQEKEEKKRRELERKQKRKMMEKRIKAANDKEWDRIKEEIKVADKRITRLGYFVVNTFFYIAGFLTIIVLGLAIMGLADGTNNENFTDVTLNDRGIEFESCTDAKKGRFAGYSTFLQMAQACCCQPDPYIKEYRFNERERRRKAAELWTCPLNTETKMRAKTVIVRELEEDGVVYNGYQFRDFCGKTYKNNYKDQCIGGSDTQVLIATNVTISSTSFVPSVPQKYLF